MHNPHSYNCETTSGSEVVGPNGRLLLMKLGCLADSLWVAIRKSQDRKEMKGLSTGHRPSAPRPSISITNAGELCSLK